MKKPRAIRIEKKRFISVVKEHTQPGPPAFAALARELGVTLVEPRHCAAPECKNEFIPNVEHQQHCSVKCSNIARQRRWYNEHEKAEPAANTEPVEAPVQA
jgi:hypothetical protein